MDDGSGSIHLQIITENSNANTIFEPSNCGIEKRDSSIADSVSPKMSNTIIPPETKLTLFALRLAVFEKAATGLGTLGFIWATVVLLGGFAIALDKTDFWCITIILLIEGTRIFSRSHELEWQHQATWSITDMGVNSIRALKTSSIKFVGFVKGVFSWKTGKSRGITSQRKTKRFTWTNSVCYGHQWVFLSQNISKFLYWLQILSATACIVLSLMKLIKRNYGEVSKNDTDKKNRKAALIIFYSLALAEALLFLMEKAYWEWKVRCCELLEEVNKECELGPSGMISIRRFFYDAYSRCVNGSIFDGLKMNMVGFGMELLGSNSPDEQLIGARILRQLAKSEQFSDDTLQKIGINLSTIERLVEILSWKNPREEEIRRSAAEILSKLAGKKQNSLRVAGIPGAMESISSLLQTNRCSSSNADEIGEKGIVCDRTSYGFWTFNHLGLVILKKLARDHDNCGKMGNTRGLLPKIIDFTHAEERLLKEENVAQSQILTLRRSLQLVKMLASTTGTTGKYLRREISEIVFTVSNIRDILKNGEKQPILQKLGIEILTSLAQEGDATERIGGTGGVIKELFNIFFRNRMLEDSRNNVRIAAGEALAMLALESRNNCHRMLKLNLLEKLVAALEVSVLCVTAARILRNLCTYTGSDCFHQLKAITTASPTILRAIMCEQNKLQEVMVGLAACVFRYMTCEESSAMFESIGIKEADLAGKLVEILRKYDKPTIKVPRIRRFAIELAIWMMQDKIETVYTLKNLGMEKELEGVLETTAEIESFNIFSGTVGLNRHETTIHSLVETSLKLMAV